jgi:hypothetical protein
VNIIICGETSGETRIAFRVRGHNAWSCDLLPAEDDSAYHIVGDMFDVIALDWMSWDLMIAHPSCTYLCSSGLHWNKRVDGRQAKTEAALDDVRRLLDCDIPMIALENPVGCIGSQIRKADQYVQPHEFGHDASKRTGLWLKGLPLLTPTEHIKPRMVDGKPRWANQTDSGQNRLGPSDDRWKERSRTYYGISKAMAEQWGKLLDIPPTTSV